MNDHPLLEAAREAILVARAHGVVGSALLTLGDIPHVLMILGPVRGMLVARPEAGIASELFNYVAMDAPGAVIAAVDRDGRLTFWTVN